MASAEITSTETKSEGGQHVDWLQPPALPSLSHDLAAWLQDLPLEGYYNAVKQKDDSLPYTVALWLEPLRYWIIYGTLPSSPLDNNVFDTSPQHSPPSQMLGFGRKDLIKLARFFLSSFVEMWVRYLDQLSCPSIMSAVAALDKGETTKWISQQVLNQINSLCDTEYRFICWLFIFSPELLNHQKSSWALRAAIDISVQWTMEKYQGQDGQDTNEPLHHPSPGAFVQFCMGLAISKLSDNTAHSNLFEFVFHVLLEPALRRFLPPNRLQTYRLNILSACCVILRTAVEPLSEDGVAKRESIGACLICISRQLPSLLIDLQSPDIISSSILSELCGFLVCTSVKTTHILEMKGLCLVLLSVPWPQQQLELLVKAFMQLHSRLVTAQMGLECLSVCLFEFPSFMSKVASPILNRICQTSHVSLSAGNLKFISWLAFSPKVYSNFTVNDYKSVFGLCLNCLRPSSSASTDSVPAMISVRCSLLIKQWFSLLRVSDRKSCLLFIQGYLSSISTDMEALLDYLWMVVRGNLNMTDFISYPSTLLDLSGVVHQNMIVGNCLLTIMRSPTGGHDIASAVKLLVRRASGVYCLNCSDQLDSEYSKNATGPLSIVDAFILDPVLASEKVGLYHCANERPYSATAPPISTIILPITEDSSLNRTISVLDRTPFMDVFKVGVVLLTSFSDSGYSFTQHQDPLALSNIDSDLRIHSSYYSFLDSSFTKISLLDPSSSWYLGGLDHQTDGHSTYVSSLPGIQILLHVSSMMPNHAHDPARTLKIRHIGNDPVVLLWNEGSRANAFQSFGEFTLFCIVIQPLDGGDDDGEDGDETRRGISACYQIDVFHRDTPTIPSPSIRSRSTKCVIPLLWDACMNSVVLLEERGINVRCCVERWKTLQRVRQRALFK